MVNELHALHAPWMQLALAQAQRAADMGEVPVGAVVVRNGELLSAACNQTVHLADPSAHAEVLALRAAAHKMGNHRLSDCTLYVTLEPCAMCSGAVFQARLKTVVFAAQEPKTGAAGSVINLFANRQLNHQTEVVGGILADESAQLLAAFFQQRRSEGAAVHQSQRLVDGALRTPANAFGATAVESQYTSQLPSAEGMRLHYVWQAPEETGAMRPAGVGAEAKPALVLLHPLWHWSQWWAPLLQAAAAYGWAIVAPDLMGWGRSDKPKRAQWHQLDRHAQMVRELLAVHQITRAVLVCQDGSEAIARACLTHGAAAQQQASAEGGAALLQVLGVVQLAPAQTAGLWPARTDISANKKWRVRHYLEQHMHAAHSIDAACVDDAAAPYPDAGHARNWGSACFAQPEGAHDAAWPESVALQRLDTHAHNQAALLAEQLQVFMRQWTDEESTPPA